MWYFEERGQTTGPLQDLDIRAAIAAGRLNRATLVWRDGMGGWLPAQQTELAQAFAAPGMGQGGPPMLQPAQMGYSAPGYGAPGYGGPGYGGPGYGTGFGAPGYGGGPTLRFAGFWIRFAAYIIDAVLVQIGAYALGALVGAIMAQAVLISDQAMELTNVQIASGAVGLIWAFVYYLVSQAGRWQATPGKRLLGLRIIRTDGQRVGVGLALGRYLSYIVSALILSIGFLMIGWTDQKKGLHDMMCGTRVVYGKA